MDRAEGAGLGVAALGHVLLFGALSLLVLAPKPVPPLTQPVDIQIVDEVGLKDTAPNPSPVEPAASVAPEVGPPVEAPPPAPAPAPLPKAAPTVAPPKPAPKIAAPAAKPAPPRQRLALDLSRPSAQTQPPRGSRLGSDFLKGVTDRPTASTAQAPRAPIGTAQMAGLANAIRRQVQPCANRIVSPGPGAENIVTKLNLRMNRDGSFAATPQVVSQVTDAENARYAARVAEAARGAFVRCAPFELPAELYDGWQNINLNYKLPG